MEWAFGALIVVMLGLYIWSTHLSPKREITKRIQRFTDDLFDSHPRETDESERRENSN